MSTTAASSNSGEELSALVLRAARGDQVAEREVCKRVVPAIRLFATRRLRARDAVDDFVQDALLLLIEAMRAGRVEDHGLIGLFALGICRNLARERARLGERRHELWQRYGPLVEATWEPSELVSRARLEDCLGRLTQRSRELLRRAFVECESNAEIGAALGLTEANARVVRHRALDLLRECVEAPAQRHLP
ncbi:MAG: sigma-70 family RNA polymerase sigma factor [Polyangiaceae bacterium]|nr:sigma-70 family RNA polymerase sigma factor [Polyangiaceae bacterium]